MAFKSIRLHARWLVATLLALALVPAFAQPPAATAKTGQAEAAAHRTGNYQMGPGDKIMVNVYDTPELSLTTRIDNSGDIGYPLLGEVHVGGLTETAAADKIGRKLEAKHLIKDPSVTITVEEFKSHRVSVLGEVAKPGEYYLSSQRTVVDVLGKAGWLKPDGADYVRLTRDNGEGGKKQYRLALNALTSGQSKAMTVQPGDVIFVPKEQQFYIQGAVNKPGAYRLRQNMTVMEALSIGGGLTKRGSRRRIELKRRGDDGEIHTYDAEPDSKLQPNDTILVKERLF